MTENNEDVLRLKLAAAKETIDLVRGWARRSDEFLNHLADLPKDAEMRTRLGALFADVERALSTAYGKISELKRIEAALEKRVNNG